jgi:hypothetical protein
MRRTGSSLVRRIRARRITRCVPCPDRRSTCSSDDA